MKNFKPTQNSRGGSLADFADTEDEIQDVCMDLLTSNPFFGHVISSINRELVDKDDMVESTQIQSLGISTVKLDINYRLWAPLAFKQKTSRFQHEVLHFVFMHPWKEKPKNEGLFYTACDISVNMHSDDKTSLRLENFDKLSSKYNCKIDTSDGYFSIYNSLVTLWQKVPGELLKSVNYDQEAYSQLVDQYISMAMKGEFFDPGTTDLNESIIFLPKNSKGDANGSGLNALIQAMKAGGASDEEIQEAIQQFLEQAPDPWDQVAEGTAESAAEDLVKRILSDSKAAGTVPGSISDYVDMFLSPPKIDWRKELRNFTKNAGKVTRSQTMSRRSKRYGTFPSGKIRREQRIAIAVDTSGSMTDDMFTQAISEVRGALMSNCEVVIIQADCVVDNVDIYKRKLPNISRVQRFGGGGTSFDDALEYIKTGGRLDKHEEFPRIGKVDGTVYITDGYAPVPERKSYPRGQVLWLTTEKSVETMRNEGFKGKILFLDCEDL